MIGTSLIECVPNFSEGRDLRIIEALEKSASEVAGAWLLDRNSDPDHNRTVLTIAGGPAAVAEAAFRTAETAVQLISLPRHEGVHPRIGAVDVVPFVPVRSATLEQCAAIAVSVGERLWCDLGVPVFLYEAAARDSARARLETIRSSDFRGLPDFGSGRHPAAGAAVVGARNFLIAWNINLASEDLTAARAVARQVRQSSGGLPFVKALGLRLASRKHVQVSINLTDFEATPLHVVFDAVRAAAALRGISVVSSELIGLIPRRALEGSAGHNLQWSVGDRIENFVLEDRIERLEALER